NPGISSPPLSEANEPGSTPGVKSSELDFDVHARGEIELHQRIDRLGVRLHDVEQPLVGTDLELLARLLVDVRAAVHGELLDARRQRNRTPDERASATGGIRDLTGSLVEHAVIEGLEAHADILSFHCPTTDLKEPPDHPPALPGWMSKTKDRPARRLSGCGAAPRKNTVRPGRIRAGAAPILLRDLADN